MADKTLEQALRKAGLKSNAAEHIKKNKDFARLVVQFISLLSTSLGIKINTYHGKADLSRLEEVVEEVQRRDKRIRDYVVAEALGLSSRAFSNLLRDHPEVRMRYNALRDPSTHATHG